MMMSDAGAGRRMMNEFRIEVTGSFAGGIEQDVNAIRRIAYLSRDLHLLCQAIDVRAETDALYQSCNMDMPGIHFVLSHWYQACIPSPLRQLSSTMGMEGLILWMFVLALSISKGT